MAKVFLSNLWKYSRVRPQSVGEPKKDKKVILSRWHPPIKSRKPVIDPCSCYLSTSLKKSWITSLSGLVFSSSFGNVFVLFLMRISRRKYIAYLQSRKKIELGNGTRTLFVGEKFPDQIFALSALSFPGSRDREARGPTKKYWQL